MALPIYLSPCVQDVAGWLYHHPSGHRNWALARELDTTSKPKPFYDPMVQVNFCLPRGD